MFTPNLVVGLTVMAVGVVLLLDTLGIRDAASMMKFLPALIVLFGASIIAQAFRPADPAVAEPSVPVVVPLCHGRHHSLRQDCFPTAKGRVFRSIRAKTWQS